MRFSNYGMTWSEWEPYAASKDWVLSKKKSRGNRIVYVEYRDQAGNTSTAVTDTIVLKKKR